MFNKFTVFAALAVTLLVASACGHPTAEAEETDGDVEETTARHDLRVRMTSKKFLGSAKDCYKHGKDVFSWMKKKFGLLKTTTITTTDAAPPTPLPPNTVTDEPAKMSGYETTDPAIDGDVVPGSVDGNSETSGEVDETPEAGGQVEPATGGGGDSVENPYPIEETLSEFADQPTIDVRSTF